MGKIKGKSFFEVTFLLFVSFVLLFVYVCDVRLFAWNFY